MHSNFPSVLRSERNEYHPFLQRSNGNDFTKNQSKDIPQKPFNAVFVFTQYAVAYHASKNTLNLMQ